MGRNLQLSRPLTADLVSLDRLAGRHGVTVAGT
jgi:hypothetical protein